MDRYTINREVASVASGKILLCTDDMTNHQVIIKRIRHTLPMDKEANELKIHRHLSKLGGHKNVLMLERDFLENGYDHFVIEYCAKGELFDVVASAGRLDTTVAMNYFEQIVSGVQFIHDRGYAHMDLSLENVLIDVHGVLKVIDFGLAVPIYECQRNAVGKYFYMAPEMYTGQMYDPSKSDVWSLGIMLFIMLTGNPPFSQANMNDAVFEYVSSYGLHAIISSWKIEHLIPKFAMDLLDKMLMIDPKARCSIHEIRDFLEKTPTPKLIKSQGKHRPNVRSFLKNVFGHSSKKVGVWQ
ncbi:kinase [Thraustotheca clavata]|uniref:Kinase n=1 Tax=Thraustotheca clavata TaxID=74557 RepID=A0A1V9YV39_9STRA|nr:kinase [Thraustotheca clavata]